MERDQRKPAVQLFELLAEWRTDEVDRLMAALNGSVFGGRITMFGSNGPAMRSLGAMGRGGGGVFSLFT